MPLWCPCNAFTIEVDAASVLCGGSATVEKIGHEGGSLLSGTADFSVLQLEGENLVLVYPLHTDYRELIQNLEGEGTSTTDEGVGCDYSQRFSGRDYVTCPPDNWGGPWTISCWLRINQGHQQRAIFSRRGILFGYDVLGELHVAMGDTDAYGLKKLKSKLWYHLAAAFDGTSVSFFVDGRSDGAEPGEDVELAGSTYIGRHDGAAMPMANIEDLRVYSTVLDETYLQTERANICQPNFYTAGPGESP